MRRLLLVLTLAGLAAGSLAVPVAAAGTTRMVDGDGRASPGDCGGSAAAYKKVQPAVDASGRNDTVVVCPGTYSGRVRIGPSRDGLTIRASSHLVATLRLPPAAVDGAIVHIRAGADDVSIVDLRLRKRTTGPSFPASECGIIAGIQVDGTDAGIRSNTIEATGTGTLSPCGMRYGVAIGYDGEGASADLRYNIVKDFVYGGIAVGGPGAELYAFRNIVRYYHRDAEFLKSRAAVTPRTRFDRAATRAARARHRGTGPAGGPGDPTGIAVFLDASGVVDENTVASHPSSGPLADPGGANIYLRAGISLEDSSASSATGNRVYRAGEGIIVVGSPVAGSTPGVNVMRNLVIANGTGIGIDAFGGEIARNEAYGNGVGITAGPASVSVTFLDNRAANNVSYDCYDPTSGVRPPANTANTWLDNIGVDAFPEEICDPGDPF